MGAKLTRQHAVSLLNSMKPIIDPRLMHFAYYKGEPVAFFLMMIDLNQIYKGLNGNDKGLNALKVLWRIKVSKICDRAISLVFGVVPEHRKKGLEPTMATFMPFFGAHSGRAILPELRSKSAAKRSRLPIATA